MKADKWRTAAEIVHSRPGNRRDVSLLTDKAAGQPADDQIAPSGVVSAWRHPQSSDVSRELHDRVLETGAGA